MTMPPKLRKAHQANDAAVLAAYGFDAKATECEIVSNLFEMYAKLTDVRKEFGLYRLQDTGAVDAFVASTPETRRICNDPRCLGLDYTRGLSKACAAVLKSMGSELQLVERETAVVNILRGGLNYGLREALGAAYGWNVHATCFLSAQRAQDGEGDGWHITETAYRKLRFPKSASLVIGDVVATGTSLAYALDELIATAQKADTSVRRIVFFTFGGPKALAILKDVDARCRKAFPGYAGTFLFCFEGVFTVPDRATPLSVKLPGTDLLRYGARMAPEFVASQYEDPAYPLERCVIYDAGSRAFAPDEYAEDVLDYWRQTRALAQSGVTYVQLLAERFPGLDAARFGAVDLEELCNRQIRFMQDVLI